MLNISPTLLVFNFIIWNLLLIFFHLSSFLLWDYILPPVLYEVFPSYSCKQASKQASQEWRKRGREKEREGKRESILWGLTWLSVWWCLESPRRHTSGMSVRVFQEKFNWVGKTPSEFGRCHPVSWDPELIIKGEKAEECQHSSSFASWLWLWYDLWAHVPLPFLLHMMDGSLSNCEPS